MPRRTSVVDPFRERHPKRVRAAVDASRNALVPAVRPGLTQISQCIVMSTLEQPLVGQTALVSHLVFIV